MKNVCRISVCVLTAMIVFNGAAFAGSENRRGGRMDPRKMFDRMDADGSGELTLEEFTTAFERRAEARKQRGGEQNPAEGAMAPPAPEDVFNRMDSNGDGGVTLEEFTTGRPAGRGRTNG